MDRFNRCRIELLNQTEKQWLLKEYNTSNLDAAQIAFWYENYKNFRPNTRCYICDKELSHEQVRRVCVGKKFRTCQNKCQRIAINNTNMERYGGNAPACSNDIVKKMQSTTLEKYGVVHFSQSSEFNEKFEKTCLERYGVRRPWQLKQVREKAWKTYEEKTGYSHNMKNPNVIKKREEYWVDKAGVKSNLCLVDPSKYKRSAQEIEIENFILQTGLVDKGDLKISDRTILRPLELDILIKSKNLAIEFNGNHQHQIIYKDKNYHYNKTIECEKQGIRLIHIWYEDFIKNKDFYFQIIRTYLSGEIPNSQSGVLDRDIFSKLDFPDYKEVLPELEITGKQGHKIFRTGFLVKGL